MNFGKEKIHGIKKVSWIIQLAFFIKKIANVLNQNNCLQVHKLYQKIL